MTTAAVSARGLQVAAAAGMEEMQWSRTRQKRSCRWQEQQSCGEGQQSRRVAVKGNNRAGQERSCGEGSGDVVKGNIAEELQWRATTDQSCRWSSNVPYKGSLN